MDVVPAGRRAGNRVTELGAPVRPRTELEAELLEMWSDRVEVAPLGVTDHFFALGGDSLLAVRLVAAAQKRYGVRLDRRRLFASFTVAVMADLVSEALGRADEQA
ncbi:MAG: acyl carrier protein [Sciscionella sp.]